MRKLRDLFRKKRPEITLTFSPDGLRCTEVAFSPGINANVAMNALNKHRVDLYTATLHKAKERGLRQPGAKQLGWIQAQKIGDVL